MKVLIIGSKGFIGSNCYNYFAKEHDVWGTDIYTDYNEKNYILFDALSSTSYSLFQNREFDICINCAGAASVPDSWVVPMRDFELNTHLVARMLDSIRVCNPICRFINISSAAVYGTPQRLPVEEDVPLRPLSPYGQHKVYAEGLCKEFFQLYGIRTCSVRIFSAYGPGLKKQIFWDWFLKSRNVNSLLLPGTGKESRDYIYISDIVKAISLIMTNAEWQGEAYNIGSGNQYQIDQVAEVFFKQLNWSGELRFDGKLRQGDPLHWQADIRKLQAMGFETATTLEGGIEHYIEWATNL